MNYRDATSSSSQPPIDALSSAGQAEVLVRNTAEDARELGRSATDAAQDLMQQARTTAKSAADTGRAYAREAVNAAGKKLDDIKGQATHLKEKGTQFVADEPMKAVAYAAAGSAVLTALLVSLLRGRR